MQEIYTLIEDIADSDATVLIQGESGTGKELVAQAIHYQASRSNKPFVKVNCSALAETLLETELFGHVKGAFTGAIRDKIGRFELAQGGTIFLDEIGDISPAIQVKLLRVLQEKEIERVGSTKSIKVDVRVITATNKDLKKLMQQNKFREDLFYRLYVIPIHLSPLRERKEDIPLLVEHFIGQFKNQTGKNIESFSEDALKLLLDYSWPGNVRELENAIEHAFVKCRTHLILPEHLPQEVLGAKVESPIWRRNRFQEIPGAKKGSAVRKRRRLTYDQLYRALKESQGNKTLAAKQLGIGRTTLWRKLKKG
jgi:transcriptional regulator with PAS, ATPase and Fis domain